MSELPPTAAVMTGDCAAVTAAAVAVNVVELEPAGTVTEAGTDRDELLEVRLTDAPPVGASAVRIRVQVVEPAGARLEGRQARELGITSGADVISGGIKVNTALREVVPSDAVTVSLVLVVTLEALAVNAPEVDPAAMTKEEGTVRLVLEPPIVRVMLLGAAPLKVAVQLEVPGVVMEVGLHTNELNTGIEPTVSVLPVALAATDPPIDEAATGFPTLMLILPRVIAGVIETVATIPSEMEAVFTPEARH